MRSALFGAALWLSEAIMNTVGKSINDDWDVKLASIALFIVFISADTLELCKRLERNDKQD